MDFEAVQKARRYQRVATPSAILGDLAALVATNDHYKAMDRRWSHLVRIGVLGMLLWFVAFVALTPFLSSLPEDFPGYFALGFPLLIVVTIVGSVGGRKWARGQLPAERRHCLTSLCSLVRADMPVAGSLSAFVDLVEVEDKQHCVRTDQRGKWELRSFVQPWLQLQGRFIDGTRFAVQVTARREVRCHDKRSSSGRIKTRFRRKRVGHLLEVRLRPQAGRAGDLSRQAADQVTAAVKLPDGSRLMRSRISSDAARLRVWIPEAEDLQLRPQVIVENVAFTLLSLYRVIGLAQAPPHNPSTS